MTVDGTGLSISLNLERMTPISAAPTVQEQSPPESSGENDRSKPRRDRPLLEETSAEPSEEEGDSPFHRIDRLA
jgi:hypothetical protein